MIEYQYECYGCPECVHCERNELQTAIFTCDECGTKLSNIYYLYDDNMYCEECLYKIFISIMGNKLSDSEIEDEFEIFKEDCEQKIEEYEYEY